MLRVLEECERAAAGFEADAVHDLRVSLRRCRSLADGMMVLDPDPSWKEMKKAGKKLFQALGELRDMQVMEEWIEKLGKTPGIRESAERNALVGDETTTSRGPIDDPVVVKLLGHIKTREVACKHDAFKDLDQFDRKQWRRWSRSLPQRSARVRPGSDVFLHLALEKWTEAHNLHKYALRSRSQIALHQLRIGIKRFRYTVENFLPHEHEMWGDDLKELQDILGEVHDLDVLWATAVKIGAFPDDETRTRWRRKLTTEREKRIVRYRVKMVGRESLWKRWRKQLPDGPQLRAAAMSRLRTWAGYQDPDFAHSQRVAQLALLLYDRLAEAELISSTVNHSAASISRVSQSRTTGAAARRELDIVSGGLDHDPRVVLEAAALMRDVGKRTRSEKHQKKSYRLIRELPIPLGWSTREMALVAVVAKYHRGKLPHATGKTLKILDPSDRRLALQLAGILRLASALDLSPEPRLEVDLRGGSAIVRVAGYSASEQSAQDVAAARHLLETVLQRPVLVTGLRLNRVLPRRRVPVHRENQRSLL